MPKYVIEREIPGVGKMAAAELRQVARRSVGVLHDLGADIQWVHSYVTGDKIYCVYVAEHVDLIREHARLGGFPANSICEVKNIIEPITAE